MIKMPYGGSCGRRIDLGFRESGCGDQGEEGCGPKRASAARGDLEEALAAMIVLWLSGHRCGHRHQRRMGSPAGARRSLIEVAAQEEETNGRAGAKGTGTVEKGNKLA